MNPRYFPLSLIARWLSSRSKRSRKRLRHRARRTSFLQGEMLEPRAVPTATPQFLTDINVQPAGVSVSTPIAERNGLGYFVSGGNTIWKSDGTTAGSAPVVQLQNSTGNPTLTSLLTNVNGTLFFRNNDGVNGWELWASDGTAAGTHLVKDINPGPGDSTPNYLTNFNGTLFFTANDGTHGSELWKSDGTADGTVMVQDINPDSADATPNHLTAIAGLLYFGANDGVNGKSLWRTDGTPPGTVELLGSAAIPTSAIALPLIVEMNGSVYFAGNDGMHGVELWKTDGTVLGTSQLADIRPGAGSSNPSAFVNVGGTLFFAANDGVHGTELWKSDGTPDNTSLVAELATGSTSASFSLMTNLSGKLVFIAMGSKGVKIWTSDGTAGGTQSISPLGLDPQIISPRPVQVNGVLYFQASLGAAGDELWRTDGTSNGTFQVKDILPGPEGSRPRSLSNIGGKLFFTASGSPTGLWVSDGTSDGTHPVTLTPPATGPGVVSDINAMTQVGPEVYFAGDDGLSGDELWKTDGTVAGTVRVKDIVPGPSGSRPIYFANVNGVLFFTTFNLLTQKEELWQSDGTEQGTIAVTDSDGNVQTTYWQPANVNGQLFFVGAGMSLRETDGTPGGATIVKPGISGFLDRLANIGGTLYFRQTQSNDEQLWKSDGADGGTVAVADFPSGALTYGNATFTNVNGTLFFAEHTDAEGTELWKSDGTSDGTVLVKDINPGSGNSKPAYLANINGTLYFTANDGTHGAELWKSDGTDAGTVMIKDINPGAGDAKIRYLTEINGAVMFVANDGVSGPELWKTDGTPEGTILVKDIFPGSVGSSPFRPTNIGGVLYFEANDGTHGFELWRSDGTTAGTFRISDINPGPAFAGSSSIFPVGGHLLFAADDGTHGRELWTIAEINAAPSFVPGPDINITDEQSHLAPATVISFDGLHGSPDAPFYFYDKDGFTVRPTDGRWLQAQDVSHITGDPAPALWGDAYTGALEVTRTGGGQFSFDSVDVTTWTFGEGNSSGQYTITGLLGGQVVYATSGELPPYETSGFITVDSPSRALVDTVRLSFVRGTQSYLVDNIRVIPTPSSGDVPWATEIRPGPPDEAGQTVHFVVTGNSDPQLFAVEPSIDSVGNLIFAPRPNASGTATITVELRDDGGTASSGVDGSTPQSFKINITKQHLWHNTLNPLDASLDGSIAPGDALDVINYINAFGPGLLPPDPSGSMLVDVTGDDHVAPDDALAIIDYINAQSLTSAATFLTTDTVTQGSWQGVYGDDGYALAPAAASLPSYASVVPYANTFVWADSTSDLRALQNPGGSDRMAAAWLYNYNGFVVDVNLKDSQDHRLALYLLDWDGNNGRSERIDILDAQTGAVLNSQAVTNFSSGKYLVWLLRGHVQIRITPLVADDVHKAVLSGLFLG